MNAPKKWLNPMELKKRRLEQRKSISSISTDEKSIEKIPFKEAKKENMDKDSIGFKLTRMYANMSLPEQTLTKMVREKRNVLCKELPWDWSLKQSIVVLANFSMDELRSSVRMRSALYEQGSNAVLNTPLAMFEKGRDFWTMSNEMSENVMENWQTSFQSCYYTYLQNKTSFCVDTKVYSILFYTKHEVPCAVVSRSTKDFRALLKEYDIACSMPYSTNAKDEVNLDMAEELKILGTKTTSSGNRSKTMESLLLFTGNQNVHGLYDIVLNDLQPPAPRSNATLTQTIYAAFQFDGATHQKVYCQFTQQKNTTNSNEIIHRIDLSGIILPSKLALLCKALQIAAKQTCGIDVPSFQLYLETVPWTAQFNIDEDSTRLSEVQWNKAHGYQITKSN